MMDGQTEKNPYYRRGIYAFASPHLAMLCQRHLQQAFQIFSYFDKQHNLCMVDPTYPAIDETRFKEDSNWFPFYGNVKEEIPSNAPEP
jgi:hypothetical protein